MGVDVTSTGRNVVVDFTRCDSSFDVTDEDPAFVKEVTVSVTPVG